MRATTYVILTRKYKSRAKTWETYLAVTEDRPQERYPQMIAAFEVAATKTAAPGVVAEWLYKGRSAAMGVREMEL